MLTLLKNLIRVQMEYACMVWSPTDSASIHLLEGIQRTFISKLARFWEFWEFLGCLLRPPPTESAWKYSTYRAFNTAENVT